MPLEGITEENSNYLEYGISIEKGLSLSMNDMKLYLDMIRMFLKKRSMQDTMWQFIAEQNMKDYSVFVHGLKGSARALGADRLADIAYEHEKKSKAQDLAYVKAHWEELTTVWEHTLDGFQEYYDRHCEGEDDACDMENENGGEGVELSQDALEEVIALLEEFERSKSIEIMKTWLDMPLEQGMRKRIKEVLTVLEDEFDYDKAIELLKEERR